MLETIRKFGIEYCDLPTMLWNVTIMLRVVTLNIHKLYNKRIPVIFYIITMVIFICYFYVYQISMVWFVFVRCPETGDRVAAMVVFSLGIVSAISVTKLFYMFLNIDLVRDIVERYLICDSTVVPGTRCAKNIRKTLRIVKRRAIIFWFFIVSNGMIYGMKPIIMPGRHFMEDSLIIYGLEPMYESPNYEIAFCITLAGVIGTVYLTAHITAFLIIITGYTEAQMLALSEEITHLWADAQKYYNINHTNEDVSNEIEFKTEVINTFIKKELSEIVKMHTMNINLVRQIENAFRNIIATEFLLLIISLIAELLGGLENTYLEIPFALTQVAMECLIGQRLIDASITFENAVYNSKWENFNTPNMKTVLIILRNSQRNLTLSAGGVTILSFTSLMSVLKSVYSAYTTLRSTMNTK